MALLPGARAADLSCSTVLANAAVSSCAKSHVWPQAMQLLQGGTGAKWHVRSWELGTGVYIAQYEVYEVFVRRVCDEGLSQ